MTMLPVITAAWLLGAGAIDPLDENSPTDRIAVVSSGKFSTLSWQDAEDRLDGFIEPATPVSGRPFQVSLRVGTFQGEPFRGPLTITVRGPGEQLGTTTTVEPSDGRWRASFTPAEAGPHSIDVGMRTTRLKLLHGAFEVRSRFPIPLSLVGLVVVALLGATFVLLYVRRVIRRPAASS